jgi:hypothetical protein
MSSIPGNGKTAHIPATGGRVGPGPAAPQTSGLRKPSVDKGPSSVDRKSSSVDKSSVDKGSVDRGSVDKGSVDKQRSKSAAAGKGKLSDRDRKRVTIAVACLIVGLCAMSVYGYFNWFRKPKYIEPPLNTGPVEVARFVITPTFDTLEFERQLVWMDKVGDHKKEFEELYKNGKITEEQFRDAKAISWLGKRFRHIKVYESLKSELQKKAYLDKLINDSILDDEEDKKAEQAGTALPKKDNKKVKLLVEKFPAAQRQEYDAFGRALKEREEQRKKEAKAAKKAGEASTRPTTRPTTR